MAKWFPNLIAVAIALTTSVVLYLVPLGTQKSVYTTPGGAPSEPVVEQLRLSEMTGYGEAGTIALLLIPVAITALPLVIKKRGLLLASAALLTLLCFLAGFSIGLFYVPAAIALWVAARRSAPA